MPEVNPFLPESQLDLVRAMVWNVSFIRCFLEDATTVLELIDYLRVFAYPSHRLDTVI